MILIGTYEQDYITLDIIEGYIGLFDIHSKHNFFMSRDIETFIKIIIDLLIIDDKDINHNEKIINAKKLLKKYKISVNEKWELIFAEFFN